MRTKEEILDERRVVVEEYQKLQGRADPETTKKREMLAARAHKLDDEIDKTDDVAQKNPDSEAAEKPSRKNRLAVVVFITVILVSCGLIYWALWSALERGRANNYAAQLTRAWKDAANAKKALRAAETKIKELETAATAPSAPATSVAPDPAVTGTTQVASVAATPAPAPATPVTTTLASAPSNLAETLKLATVGRGEGIEHAFIRQLEDNPEEFGFDGDANDKVAVKKWAGQEAHRLAIKAGYVCPDTGREIRVKKADQIAFVLYKDTDGNLMVAEHEKGGSGNFKNDPTDEGPVKAEGAVVFEGDTSDGVQSYEYVYSSMPTSEPVPAVSSLAVPTAPVVAVAEFWSRA